MSIFNMNNVRTSTYCLHFTSLHNILQLLLISVDCKTNMHYHYIITLGQNFSTMDDGQKSDISMPETHVLGEETRQTPPTLIETKLTVQNKDMTVNLVSKISVGKSEDLFLVSKLADPFLQCLNKLQSDLHK